MPEPPGDPLAFDRAHLWHPYTSMTAPATTRLVTSAHGVRLRLADGSELIDAMASWWCAIHGYRHPALDDAARRQLDAMSHVMFGGLTHEPAVELGRRLVAMTADPLQHVFFSDSGSVAVEVAIKMALQAQRGRGRPGRCRLLALRGGYHGDTAGAMSLTDPVSGMHTAFAGILPRQIFTDRPPAWSRAALTATAYLDGSATPQAASEESAAVSAWTAAVRSQVERHADELAAIVCEPVLQGAGGMHAYSPACLQALRELCDEHGLLLIADEIATGFGRTGRLFAVEHAGVVPDIACVGKALTGGYLSLAATICSSQVADAIGGSDVGVLMHGPTFMANPLACSVAVANLDLLATSSWRDDVRRIEAGLRAGLAPATSLKGVADVRVLGAVGVVQLDRPVDVEAATAAAVAQGVWIRPFRDLIYTMPPYVIGDDDLETLCAALVKAAAA